MEKKCKIGTIVLCVLLAASLIAGGCTLGGKNRAEKALKESAAKVTELETGLTGEQEARAAAETLLNDTKAEAEAAAAAAAEKVSALEGSLADARAQAEQAALDAEALLNESVAAAKAEGEAALAAANAEWEGKLGEAEAAKAEADAALAAANAEWEGKLNEAAASAGTAAEAAKAEADAALAAATEEARKAIADAKAEGEAALAAANAEWEGKLGEVETAKAEAETALAAANAEWEGKLGEVKAAKAEAETALAAANERVTVLESELAQALIEKNETKAALDSLQEEYDQLAAMGFADDKLYYYGAAEGKTGLFSVCICLDEGGAIAEFEGYLVDELPENAFLVVADEDFVAQFIGLVPPVVAGENVQLLPGAEEDCLAVIEAVNAAYEQYQSGGGFTGESINTVARASIGDIEVSMDVDSDGSIIGFGLCVENELPEGNNIISFEGFTEQFMGVVPPLVLGVDIQPVPGAEEDSQILVDAVNAAYQQYMENK